MEFNAAVIMLLLNLNIPYKCIVNTKSSKRCNLCPECPNNTKFSPQSNFYMNILGFISAEHEDKRKRKMLGSENRFTGRSWVSFLLYQLFKYLNVGQKGQDYIIKNTLLISYDVTTFCINVFNFH